ncbi:hypothetical protein BDM02DRAFT_3188951 [Thelephora ganbajun]|uniref:Uncharacterized protein n=1 Tax=Thelephora ganbajun TaxID=370292 RepID=A0ACB6Z9L9_THEGA|nr:hypothetical protein BDM02DRAFT_3188951 [Thelephora ganbajun]
MSGNENPKPVNVDPRCIQEALRLYFQPIKNDDPQLDFCTMYKRETMDYDTEYMNKCNEDLNTTLIFAGLFSAVSSAFVIAVQTKLESDSGGRSELYLRAILLSLNRSISPNEDPIAPPPWNGPPQEIITTSDLLYASLLMSLLAAFVAMLGKQWLNRYLRHTGGSMVERCGDRQRKSDGLKKWPFRLFIESLPIMLQIALLLLACGLSRYMWSVNTSVACVVISFTVLGFLFYIGIVVAGTYSYECPFQTPASITLRDLSNTGIAQTILASLSPPNVISFIYATRRNTRKLALNLSPPNVTSLIYATWMDARQRFAPASHRAYEIMRYPFSQGISLSHITSGIQSAATKVGHQAIILLLQIDRTLGDTKQRLVQSVRRLRRAVLLPITVEDTTRHPPISQNSPALRLQVRNLEALRKQNANDARCVCWALHNITDPEAIDSAIRLAGTIRWFDGDPDYDPPFDLIVSTFEACFDSAKQLYPGMRDRAYFSARAIFKISIDARLQSREHATKYPVPAVSLSSVQHADPDLYHIIQMLKCNFGDGRSTLTFPSGHTLTLTHSLWMSNLFVDLTRAGPNPNLKSYRSYLSAAVTNHQAVIANTLLVWYILLGGHVEEETFWAVDKSDSLEAILSHLSTRVMYVIGDGRCLEHLGHLLVFLAAWEKRPVGLTPMAYQWCSTIFEAVEEPTPSGISFRLLPSPRQYNWDHVAGFPEVGPGCDPVRFDDNSRHVRGCPHHLPREAYVYLLFLTLEAGFRLAGPDRDPSALHLNHASHHDEMFKVAFSSHDDDVIADAVCVWVADSAGPPPSSCARYFAKRVEWDGPFSQRLRRVSIHALQRIWRRELEASRSETVRLLNRLKVGVDDVVDKYEWVKLLVSVIRLPTGLERLSSHYWGLLDKLVLAGGLCGHYTSRDIQVMGLLKEAGDWEKLEVWMLVIWTSLPLRNRPIAEVKRNIEQATHELLSR